MPGRKKRGRKAAGRTQVIQNSANEPEGSQDDVTEIEDTSPEPSLGGLKIPAFKFDEKRGENWELWIENFEYLIELKQLSSDPDRQARQKASLLMQALGIEGLRLLRTFGLDEEQKHPRKSS